MQNHDVGMFQTFQQGSYIPRKTYPEKNSDKNTPNVFTFSDCREWRAFFTVQPNFFESHNLIGYAVTTNQ